MNRAMRKRLQRLTQSKGPVIRRGDPQQELTDTLYQQQYMATLAILQQDEEDALKALRLAHSVHQASEKAYQVSSEFLESKLDCRSGCAYCCHTPVQAHILDAIGAAAARLSTPLAYELPTRQRDQLKKIFLPCPLLHNGQCSIYAQRPVVCRAYQSSQVDACRQRFESQNPALPVPMDVRLYGLTGMPQLASLDIFQELGIDCRPVVLGLAVAALTRDFDGMVSDWLNGGRAFEEVVVL